MFSRKWCQGAEARLDLNDMMDVRVCGSVQIWRLFHNNNGVARMMKILYIVCRLYKHHTFSLLLFFMVLTFLGSLTFWGEVLLWGHPNRRIGIHLRRSSSNACAECDVCLLR